MITPILQILASIAGVVTTWAIFKFFLIPLFQKYQDWKDLQDNNRAKEGAGNENQGQNAQDGKDQDTRDGIWDKLPKP